MIDERLRHLMMAELDGELDALDPTPDERAELARRLAEDNALAAERQELERLKELTTMSKIQSPPDAHWDAYHQSLFVRAERGLGWILVSFGAVVLIAFGLWHALEGILGDTTMPTFLKAAILALGVGGAVLLVSVAREKLFTYRHDPYKEIER